MNGTNAKLRPHAMKTRYFTFLILGLAIVTAALFFVFTATEGAHLRLDGKILKVRVAPLPGSDESSLLMVDFRVANPSDVRFVIGSAKVLLTPATGAAVEGTTISKPEVNTLFQYQKLLGPKYNDVLSLQDRVDPHASLDRMMGVKFDLSDAAIASRKNLVVRLEDVDGTVAEIAERPGLETPAAKK